MLIWDDEEDEDDWEDEYQDQETLDLGACCACGKEDSTVRNIMMLPKRAPAKGSGWGCFQCGLPMQGAFAVICDDCLDSHAKIKEVVYGEATGKRRLPVASLSDEVFDHDMSKHPEDEG